MRDSRNQPSFGDLLVWVAILILLGSIGIAIHEMLVQPRGKAFDFFTIWFGIRRIWRGQNPYGLDTTRAIQLQMFGKTLPPHQNQQGFAYPLYIAWVLGPFVLLPFAPSVTAWCTSQFLGLMAFPTLADRTFHWNPPRRDLVLFSLAVLLVFRYPTVAFVLGQMTIFVLLCVLLGLRWLDSHQDVLAGTAFALTLIKPNLSVLPVLAVLSWSICRGRRKVLVGLGGTLAALLGLSFAWQPKWLEHFLAGARGYASYANLVWPIQQAGRVWIGAIVIAVIGGLTVVSIIKAVRGRNQRDFLVAFCFVVILSLAALPQTGSYSLTLLLIPAAGFLALAPQDRWVRVGVFTSLISPWLYWWLQMQKGIQVDQIALPLQFALVGARTLCGERTGQ